MNAKVIAAGLKYAKAKKPEDLKVGEIAVSIYKFVNKYLNGKHSEFLSALKKYENEYFNNLISYYAKTYIGVYIKYAIDVNDDDLLLEFVDSEFSDIYISEDGNKVYMGFRDIEDMRDICDDSSFYNTYTILNNYISGGLELEDYLYNSFYDAYEKNDVIEFLNLSNTSKVIGKIQSKMNTDDDFGNLSEEELYQLCEEHLPNITLELRDAFRITYVNNIINQIFNDFFKNLKYELSLDSNTPNHEVLRAGTAKRNPEYFELDITNIWKDYFIQYINENHEDIEKLEYFMNIGEMQTLLEESDFRISSTDASYYYTDNNFESEYNDEVVNMGIFE